MATKIREEQLNITEGTISYIHLGMSGDQTVDNGSTVNFDTVRASNNMTRNGYGVNVLAGKTYKIMAWVNVSANAGTYLGYSLYDGANRMSPTEAYTAYTTAPNATHGYGFKAPLNAIYTPVSDTIIYVKIVDDGIATGVVDSSYGCTFMVEELTGMKGDKGDTGDVTVSDIEFEGWTAPTLQNSWVNYDGGATWETAGYCKDALGFVNLKGLVKSGSFPTTIFTLPVGYRPARSMIFNVRTNSTVGQLEVYSDGRVYASSGSNVWYSLDGITFKAA